MTRKKYTPEQISRITGLSGGLSGILTGQTGLLRAEGWEVNHPNGFLSRPEGTPSRGREPHRGRDKRV